MNKKGFVKIFVFIFIFTFLFSFYLPSEAFANKEKSSKYYGYFSKKKVVEALSDHPEISEQKMGALLTKLSTDGYFWMKTKEEKLNYIHANLPNNKFLIVVADAEDIHSDAGTNIAEVTHESSERIQEEFLDEVLKEYKQWAEFYKDTCKMPGRRYEFGAEGCFLFKNYWSENNLIKLYHHFWTDLKDNKDNYEFTLEEKERLKEIYKAGNFKEIAKDFKGWRAPSSIGYFSNSPLEDLLLLLPVEKIFGLLGKTCTSKTATWCGSMAKGKSSWFTRLRGGASRVVSALKIGGRAVSKTKPYRLTVAYLGEISLDISKIFRRSSLSGAQRAKATKMISDSVGLIEGDSVFKNFITQKRAIEILDNTEVLTTEIFESITGKKISGRCISRLNPPKIQVNQNCLVASLSKGERYRKTMVHEALHALSRGKGVSGRGVYAQYSESLGYKPVHEGMTEALTRIILKRKGVTPPRRSYRNATIIAEKIIEKFQIKYGQEDGLRVIADIYFNKGLKGLDIKFGSGAYDAIFSYIVKIEKGEVGLETAIRYINNLQI